MMACLIVTCDRKYWWFCEEDITAWWECQNTGAFLCLKSDSPRSVRSTRINSASLSRNEFMAAPSPVSTESRRLASRFVILFPAPNGQVAAQTTLASPRLYGRSSSLSFPERWCDKWLRFSASCQCIDADVSSCPYPLSASEATTQFLPHILPPR